MDTDFKKLRVSPNTWTKNVNSEHPSNFSNFALQSINCYDYKENRFDPIKNAPLDDAEEGTVYFSNNVNREDFGHFLRMMGIYGANDKYVVFVQESQNPLKDRYFKQVRLVCGFALKYYFSLASDQELDDMMPQQLTFENALWAFIESERERVKTGELRIYGSMRKDWDDSYEALCFGFMLENSHQGIYRIWSRAWIVSK